jgi:hypothetical protein
MEFDKQDFFNGLLTELSFRVEDGIPDLKNPKHLKVLGEIFDDMELYSVGDILIRNLLNEQDGYKHIGAGIFVSDRDVDSDGKAKDGAKKYRKDGEGESASYTPISDDEAEDIKKKQGEEGEKAASSYNKSQEKGDDGELVGDDQPEEEEPKGAKVQGSDVFSHAPDVKKDKEGEEGGDNFDYSNTTIVLNKSLTNYLSTEDLKIVKNFQRDYDDFEKNPTQEKADRLIQKYQLRTNNADKPKIYPGVIANSHRHIFNGTSANGSGSVKNRKIVDLINQHSSEKVPTASKKDLTDPSKPMGEATKPKSSQFGKGRTADEDAGVSNIMKPENNVSFDGMEKKYLKLYGPLDDNGNLLIPSNKHTDKYLEQALGGSLDEAIEKARELEKTMKLSPEIGNALVDYQNEQKAILEKYKGNLPNEQAAKELQDSWGKYTQRIIAVNPKMAKSMIKNQAEVFIYSYELAKGEEVYLPAHPSYPAADKIVKTEDGVNGERVTGVSVKVGDDGSVKIMGFPTENQQMLRYHVNKKYRENTSSRPGQEGYAIGLKDELVDSDLEMDKLLNESGMVEIIQDKKEYYKLLREYKQFMKDLQDNKNYYGKGAMSEEDNQKLKDKKKELVEKIQKLVDMDKLIEKCGEKNAKSLVKTSPGKLIQYINYSAASSTSGGVQGITSHSERIDSDGTVDMATKEFPNDCKKLDFSTYREHETVRNGGLLVGVTHPDSSNGEII